LLWQSFASFASFAVKNGTNPECQWHDIGRMIESTSRARIEAIGHEVFDGSITVHSSLGPGLLESTYQACLAQELRLRGLFVETQVQVPVAYKGVRLDVGYRIDLVVERSVIVDLKAVKQLHPIHEAQLLSYLKLADYRLGFLINFHVVRLRDGIKRMVNKL
jgi:GxxExxY protein